MNEQPTMTTAAFKREIRACWAELERMIYEVTRADRHGDEARKAERPDDHHLARWAPGQGEMDRLLDKLAKDCRRHRRALGAPPSSAWRCTVEEDGFLMMLRFIAREDAGPWRPIADPAWTEWSVYGRAIGAVLGDRRPAEWIARVEKIADEPRYFRGRA